MLSLVASRAIAGSGDLDRAFGDGGTLRVRLSARSEEVTALTVDPQGRILAAALVVQRNSNRKATLVRLLSDGTLDSSFGLRGQLDLGRGTEFGEVNAISVQPDGRIVLFAYLQSEGTGDWVLFRLLDSGRRDPSFGTGGRIDLSFGDALAAPGGRMIVKRDGRIVVAGNGSTGPPPSGPSQFVSVITRLFADGRIDDSFGSEGHVVAHATAGVVAGLAEQADGKLVIAGGVGRFSLLRLLSDGSPDPSFGTDGLVDTPVLPGRKSDQPSAMGIGPDGKVVVGGTSWATHTYDMTLARYSTDGTLDPTFGTGGRVTTDIGRFDSSDFALAIHPDGRILLAGDVFVGDLRHPRLIRAQVALARYSTDGSLDPTFGDDGIARTSIGRRSAVATCLAFQGNGNVLAGGYAYSADDTSHAAFASFEW